MHIILLMIFILAFCCSIIFRTALFHPIKTIKYVFLDVYRYFKHHEYNYYQAGVLNSYNAHFGGGKTLTVTHAVSGIFKRYNNKMVWDREKGKLVRQKIHIISNVHLNNIPYERLESLSQVVACAWRNKEIDKENDTRTVVLVLLDEASSQLNSRNFKTNIDADFLNALITSRHFHMSLFYTTQKHKLVDALLRSVTQTCISCKKYWRFMVLNYYNADEVELASDVTLLKPIARKCWFVSDEDYNTYDTLATVEQLKKSVDKNDMMSAEEILNLRGAINPDNDAIVSGSRKLRKIRKRK